MRPPALSWKLGALAVAWPEDCPVAFEDLLCALEFDLDAPDGVNLNLKVSLLDVAVAYTKALEGLRDPGKAEA